MMTSEYALHAALVADPTDELTWCALADWLDDDGQTERAELLRGLRRLSYARLEAAERATLAARMGTLLESGVKPVLVRMTNSIGMQFVLVEPGTFLMGSPANEANRRNNEQQHVVTLTKAFYMAIHPVTQGQWVKVMGSNPSYFSRTGGGKDSVSKISDADLAMFPVECVSWEDAQTFLNALATLNEEAKFGRQYRLPSEAEWEYACRDGGLGVARNTSQLPFHLAQPTSSLSSTQANFDGNYPYGGAAKGSYLKRTSKVGSYPANALGIYDMHGNVWEWCADLYGEYATAPCTDPTGPSEGANRVYRVYRSGSWYSDSQLCRAAVRNCNAPSFRYCGVGFRVALVSSPSKGQSEVETGASADEATGFSQPLRRLRKQCRQTT